MIARARCSTRFGMAMLALAALALPARAQAPDPLPSWNEGAARRAIVAFE